MQRIHLQNAMACRSWLTSQSLRYCCSTSCDAHILPSHSITSLRCCCVQALREVENTVGLEGYRALGAGMISYEHNRVASLDRSA